MICKYCFFCLIHLSLKSPENSAESMAPTIMPPLIINPQVNWPGCEPTIQVPGTAITRGGGKPIRLSIPVDQLDISPVIPHGRPTAQYSAMFTSARTIPPSMTGQYVLKTVLMILFNLFPEPSAGKSTRVFKEESPFWLFRDSRKRINIKNNP